MVRLGAPSRKLIIQLLINTIFLKSLTISHNSLSIPKVPSERYILLYASDRGKEAIAAGAP
jgi:hypothetical protein